jgi:D-alanyl-D-alanine carboxypeptidase (penicillin-binding protein 5/6)
VPGNVQSAASPNEKPAPIASLAKVLTAYLTLKSYPLSGAQDGFTITVTAAQAQAEAQDAAQDQSVVAARAGEQLTERQLLEALLIPSGDNIARMLAAQVAGSETRFLAEMNAEARAPGWTTRSTPIPAGSIRARSLSLPTSCASSSRRCASRSSARSSRWPA